MNNIAIFAERVGRWFLRSGIQEPDGGVARYYLSDCRCNANVSTEITGYAVSALAFLHSLTADCTYLDAALAGAHYLTRHAWDEQSATFPFEPVIDGEPAYAYFFDCGMIVRGLLAAWRATGEAEFLDRAREAGLAMAFDFLDEHSFHPVLRLPEKDPLPYESRWSRSPGCYQLKAALAWRDLGRATGDAQCDRLYERVLEYALATHDRFLPGDANLERVVDRLHAYCYFLEALLPVASRPECGRALAGGISRVSGLLRGIAPVATRSDVYAQILRLRLFAAGCGAVPLDERAAEEEAAAAAGFQAEGADQRICGGFYFGRRGDQTLPFVNPVSTAFCLQALVMWERRRSGEPPIDFSSLI